MLLPNFWTTYFYVSEKTKYIKKDKKTKISWYKGKIERNLESNGQLGV